MIRHVVAALGVLCLLAGPARAAVVFDQTFGINAATVSDAAALTSKYNDFALGAGATVNHVDWRGVYLFGGSPPPLDDFTISFYADAAGTVGAVLASIHAGDAVDRSASGESFLGFPVFQYRAGLGAGIALAAGTTYWMSIVNDTSTDADDNWFWAANSQIANPSLIDVDGVFSSQSFSSYFSLSAADPARAPEPAPLALLALGLAGMMLARRPS